METLLGILLAGPEALEYCLPTSGIPHKCATHQQVRSYRKQRSKCTDARATILEGVGTLTVPIDSSKERGSSQQQSNEAHA